MLTEKIMHECIKKLLADVEAPKQEDLECLAKLMSTVGRQLDANPKAKMYMNAYFERVTMLSKNMSLESRIRFMLQVSRCSCYVQAARAAPLTGLQVVSFFHSFFLSLFLSSFNIRQLKS